MKRYPDYFPPFPPSPPPGPPQMPDARPPSFSVPVAVADARAEAVFGPRGAHPRAEMAEAALGIQAAPAATRESFR